VFCTSAKMINDDGLVHLGNLTAPAEEKSMFCLLPKTLNYVFLEISSRRPGFNLKEICVRFVAENVALEQGSLQVLWISSATFRSTGTSYLSHTHMHLIFIFNSSHNLTHTHIHINAHLIFVFIFISYYYLPRSHLILLSDSY